MPFLPSGPEAEPSLWEVWDDSMGPRVGRVVCQPSDAHVTMSQHPGLEFPQCSAQALGESGSFSRRRFAVWL